MKLRPRIALGLVPLLLLFVALGGWAALVNRQLARELSGELKATYRALQAGQTLREAATQMSNAAALASRKGALVCVARGLLLAFSLLGIEGGGLRGGLGHGRRSGLCLGILSTPSACREPVTLQR